MHVRPEIYPIFWESKLKLGLEMFLCGHAYPGMVRYSRFFNDISNSRLDPDNLIKDMLRVAGIGLDEELPCAHSTSWRFEDGCTILTYLVWVSEIELLSLSSRVIYVDEINCPAGSGPLNPRPGRIKEEHVLAHGLRHLSYLIFEKEDPFLVRAFAETGSTALLQGMEPALAGRIELPV
jgi:hypothetical protein